MGKEKERNKHGFLTWLRQFIGKILTKSLQLVFFLQHKSLCCKKLLWPSHNLQDKFQIPWYGNTWPFIL